MCFKMVVASVFHVFFAFSGASGGYFKIIYPKKCGLVSKSADPRFLHTVQRFGLISKGLPKNGKNSKKSVLEIMVF